MGIRKKNLIGFIVFGLALICGGVMYIFYENKFFDALGIVFFTVAIIALIYSEIKGNDIFDDEMSERNYGSAYFFGFSLTVVSMFTIDIINDIVKYFFEIVPVNTTSLIFISAGIGFLATGLRFAKLDGGFIDATADN